MSNFLPKALSHLKFVHLKFVFLHSKVVQIKQNVLYDIQIS